ncbi:hypothetical protein [Microbacterium hydrocarbonoxydans]|uniref:Uncharacterized protein n=1 Tax=Microbacterium hydrocarbonoxydans TaxID=273678 RepID=A0A1H4NKH3_9MICO|nr:hypothetical protein [Microbacterium hydrocarbonoxydans]SEB95395.1 hypothetical protein SAMN04489807_2497 [Microbacterium hydrocarbonoxydans]
MTDEQQPDLRWAPLPPKPSNRGRIWLIVGIVIAVLAIVGVLLFLFLPRGAAPEPVASPTASATPSASPTPTQTAEPTEPPVQTEAPPVVDPSVEAFRTQVAPRLQDAATGLDLVANATGQDAVSIVDQLQFDLQSLADTPAPSSIRTQWDDGLSSYSQQLTDLRSALSAGSSTTAALDGARTALKNLDDLVGR